jgi:NADH dehydrogenase FAD-containing subunit
MSENAASSSSSAFKQPQGLRRLTTRKGPQVRTRSSLSDRIESNTHASTKNVLVLGGSYGGMHAATVLANKLPPSHRVILIERNSHFNHLYVFPRFSVMPGHEHKAFIPYTSIFKDAPSRRTASRTDQPVTASPRADVATVPSAKEGNGEEMLGMGSISGKAVRERKRDDRTSDRASRSPTADSVSRSVSRSSSSEEDDESLFEDRTGRRYLRTEDVSTSSAYSTASSYESSPLGERLSLQDGDNERAAKLASSTGVEQALAQDGAASRAEEKLGRPEMKVEELGDALNKGVALEEGDGPASTKEANSFENSSPHLVLQANVREITHTHVVVESVDTSESGKGKLWSIDSVEIPYDHLVYALGSHLPDPLRTETRFKKDGMTWMQNMQQRVKESDEIVLVGGGALGVEFASDIKSVYPEKSVTLIHSRKQLLPNFDVQVHEAAESRLLELGVKLVLGERLALTEGCPRGSTVKDDQLAVSRQGEVCLTNAITKGEGEQARNEGMCLGNGRKRVKTTGGKEFECDLLLLCTGQQPNSELMARLSPTSVDSDTRLVRVMRSLQVKIPDPQGSLAQMPFNARPPCGDCDCFLDKKAAGADTQYDGDDGHSSVATAIPGHDTSFPNVYAIGDVADAFGSLNAGYQAWAMADVAADNILRTIEAESEAKESVELQHFHPAANMLKLSLGLGKMVFQGAPDEQTGRHLVEVREDPEDLTVEGVWTFMAGMSTEDMYI